MDQNSERVFTARSLAERSPPPRACQLLDDCRGLSDLSSIARQLRQERSSTRVTFDALGKAEPEEDGMHSEIKDLADMPLLDNCDKIAGAGGLGRSAP